MEQAKKSNFWNYNPNLKSFAKQNRRSMTKAEACLWKYLLGGRQLMGYRFNRQRPVGNYIADFLCKELMLIIEVDGLTHQFDEVRENDILRETALEALGFTVIRFDDDEVLNDIDNVRRTLMYFIETFEETKK
jgi:very-short-patch-repair endonuclease